MIIPSIDLMGGNAVQLVGGKQKVLDAGDPLVIASIFSVAGEIAIVDLDAALGHGNNEEVIKRLVQVAPCRVGGGIRDVETAIKWLDAGATQIVLGTKAVPEILKQLPKERVIAALDAYCGEVVVEGWRTKTGQGIKERMNELAPYVGGFLVTFVELEGRMAGTDLPRAEELVKAAGNCRVTIAGGITTPDDVKILDHIGADAQVGMALYTGKMELADAIAAPLTSDRPDGLWPTVITDERGIALGLAWSSRESLREAVKQKRGIYFSRSREQLWVKGETSGALQELLRIDVDCDRDCLRFVVKQAGTGFCHKSTRTCWGEDWGISKLERTIAARLGDAPVGSYTRKILDNPKLLAEKILEEAGELTKAEKREEIIWEAADVLYFTAVKLAKAGVSFADVEQHLDNRARKVTRRG